MTKHSIARFCLAAAGCLGLAMQSFAGTTVDSSKDKVVEKAKESCITGDIGFDVVSQYVSRGLIFENQGFIIQPYQDLYFKLYEGDGFLTKVTLNLSTWYSFHSRHTDQGEAEGHPGSSSTPSWYEFDFDPGMSFEFAHVLTFTPSYYSFQSPNDGFATFQGLNLALALDDSKWLGKFALHPHFTTLIELDNKAGNGSDEGVYYEVGVAPGYDFGPVAVAVPITAGFGSDNFYAHNAGFGFFSTALTATVPLKFIPECLGKWNIHGGVTYYYLGSDSLRNFNTEPANDIRSGKNSEWVFSGGMAVAF
jgi:hypothetical protein